MVSAGVGVELSVVAGFSMGGGAGVEVEEFGAVLSSGFFALLLG